MLTVGLITMMIQAEEQAKRPEQHKHIWWTERQRTIPSDRPTPRWLVGIGNFAARLGRKALRQPTVTACCVEGRSCAQS